MYLTFKEVHGLSETAHVENVESQQCPLIGRALQSATQVLSAVSVPRAIPIPAVRPYGAEPNTRIERLLLVVEQYMKVVEDAAEREWLEQKAPFGEHYLLRQNGPHNARYFGFGFCVQLSIEEEKPSLFHSVSTLTRPLLISFPV